MRNGAATGTRKKIAVKTSNAKNSGRRRRSCGDLKQRERWVARGYDVMLAEATRDLGGRVTREALLPGLSEWARVRDYRVQQLEKDDQRRSLSRERTECQ